MAATAAIGQNPDMKAIHDRQVACGKQGKANFVTVLRGLIVRNGREGTPKTLASAVPSRG